MIKRFSFLALAAVLALALSTSAQAAPVLVYNDGGGASVDVTGTAAGADVTTVPFSGDVLTSINGNSVSIPVTTTMDLTDTAGVITGTGQKVFGTGGVGSEAILDFVVTLGGISLGSHINANAVVTVLVANNLAGYDFSPLVLPGNSMAISINKTGVNYANIFNHPGALAHASALAFTESVAVPEPASMALLGIGITGLVAFRRLFKRAAKV